MHLFSQLGEKIFGLITYQGVLGLYLILGIEEAGAQLPIPGDFLLAYAGFRASAHKLSFLGAFLGSVAGVVTGSTILYSIFRFGGRPFAYKYGRYFFLPKSRLRKLEKWFIKRGRFAVIVGRFLPYARVFISAIAGLSGLRYLYFFLQVVFASSVWVLLFMGIGFVLGRRWRNAFEKGKNFGFVFFLIFVGIIVIYYLRIRKKGKENKSFS